MRASPRLLCLLCALTCYSVDQFMVTPGLGEVAELRRLVLLLVTLTWLDEQWQQLQERKLV